MVFFNQKPLLTQSKNIQYNVDLINISLLQIKHQIYNVYLHKTMHNPENYSQTIRQSKMASLICVADLVFATRRCVSVALVA